MTEQTLQKSLRLRRRRDFSRVQRQGARGSAAHLQAVVRKGRGHGRFGLTVPKKVGNAVVRNRTKRRLREILRRDRELFAGIDLVVICQAGAGDLDLVGLGEELRGAVTRARAALGRQKPRGKRPAGGRHQRGNAGSDAAKPQDKRAKHRGGQPPAQPSAKGEAPGAKAPSSQGPER